LPEPGLSLRITDIGAKLDLASQTHTPGNSRLTAAEIKPDIKPDALIRVDKSRSFTGERLIVKKAAHCEDAIMLKV
jgi:hypothetical protein